MYGVLREIMKDDLVKERQDALNTVAERMINAGKTGDEISLFTSLDRQDIDGIAHRLNRTVSWNEARA